MPSFHVIDLIISVNHLTQAREERIVALETENAMLYLKLAQVDLKLITTRLRLVLRRIGTQLTSRTLFQGKASFVPVV